MENNNIKLIVFGVGGAGNNCIANLVEAKIQGVELIAVNTDLQTLKIQKDCYTLQIGEKLTKGLGAGANPNIGRQSALESKDNITKLITGSDIVFIATGLGGGTGTGAAPEIASIAKELGILTISVASLPFGFEGERRMRMANQGLKYIIENSDSYIVLSNELLVEKVKEEQPDTSLKDAFKYTDSFFKNAIQGITDVIVGEGIINLDLEDVKTALKNSGKALMGIGTGKGEDRALLAAQAAINSPLLKNADISGAERILVNIAGPSDLSLFEHSTAAKFISSKADPNAIVLIGVTTDNSLKDEIRVTAIISGMKK